MLGIRLVPKEELQSSFFSTPRGFLQRPPGKSWRFVLMQPFDKISLWTTGVSPGKLERAILNTLGVLKRPLHCAEAWGVRSGGLNLKAGAGVSGWFGLCLTWTDRLPGSSGAALLWVGPSPRPPSTGFCPNTQGLTCSSVWQRFSQRWWR